MDMARHDTAAPRRLPLHLHNRAHLECWRQSVGQLRRSPPLKVCIEGFNADANQRIEFALSSYAKACGCASGAVAALAVLASCGAFAAAALRDGPALADAWPLVWALPSAVIAAGLAKAASISLHGRRAARVLDAAIARCDDAVQVSS